MNIHHLSDLLPARRLLSLPALALIAFFFSGCILVDLDGDSHRDNDQIARETFSFDVPVINATRIRLEAINGNVEIRGRADATSVLVTGEREVGSNSFRDAETHLADLEVEVEDLGSELLIRTIQPRDTNGRNYVVNYTIIVPVNFEVLASLVNGNVEVETIDNTVTVNTINGNVRLNDIAGDVTVVVTNGNIESEVFPPLNGSILLATTNGNISLLIPASTSAALSALVTNGSIDTSNLDLQDPTLTNRSLTATLGSGDGTIELRTVNGNIDIEGF